MEGKGAMIYSLEIAEILLEVPETRVLTLYCRPYVRGLLAHPGVVLCH